MVGISHLARVATYVGVRSDTGIVAHHKGSRDAGEPNSVTEKAAWPPMSRIVRQRQCSINSGSRAIWVLNGQPGLGTRLSHWKTTAIDF